MLKGTAGRPITRRLFIGAAFAAGASAALPLGPLGGSPQTWRGLALGAQATIRLEGTSEADATRLFGVIERELVRLEGVFSLYQPGSALMKLNREGRLRLPPQELIEVLGLAGSVHSRTNGLFDPTVQPLFQLYAEHFSTPGADPSGPGADAVDAALRRVGFAGVVFDAAQVAFARPGMGLTLNGIAQGYVTDRVSDILRAEGFDNVLVDIGEINALGAGPDGGGWRVGLRRGPDDGGISEWLSLRDRAVATSMVRGTVLDSAGRVGHIFHPHKGVVEGTLQRATVVDERAAIADAFSTAAILMNAAELEALRSRGIELHI